MMKKTIFGLIALVLLIACKGEGSQTIDVKNSIENQTFHLDGFFFGESYTETHKRIDEHKFKQIDRVEFFANKDEHKEIYPMVDLMETYEGIMFEQPMEIAFHFKNDHLQFFVLQSKVKSIQSLVSIFSDYYGDPVMRGTLFSGEIFQGDNILWRVFTEEDQELGYVSLMPIEGDLSDDDWGAIITIYPYTANPPIA